MQIQNGDSDALDSLDPPTWRLSLADFFRIIFTFIIHMLLERSYHTWLSSSLKSHPPFTSLRAYGLWLVLRTVAPAIGFLSRLFANTTFPEEFLVPFVGHSRPKEVLKALYHLIFLFFLEGALKVF